MDVALGERGLETVALVGDSPDLLGDAFGWDEGGADALVRGGAPFDETLGDVDEAVTLVLWVPLVDCG